METKTDINKVVVVSEQFPGGVTYYHRELPKETNLGNSAFGTMDFVGFNLLQVLGYAVYDEKSYTDLVCQALNEKAQRENPTVYAQIGSIPREHFGTRGPMWRTTADDRTMKVFVNDQPFFRKAEITAKYDAEAQKKELEKAAVAKAKIELKALAPATMKVEPPKAAIMPSIVAPAVMTPTPQIVPQVAPLVAKADTTDPTILKVIDALKAGLIKPEVAQPLVVAKYGQPTWDNIKAKVDLGL